ncbi:hypothetical protein [Wolbachia pipientis]|uniref:hypothetical protein n=1 Tax=Wolbachia pipientis TaxID=955 RepID=UPI00202E273A|nr:hypothetical protein [Wolbachia pipientis]MCM1001771.1 hypothetical protein [Wolbachia pipientis]
MAKRLNLVALLRYGREFLGEMQMSTLEVLIWLRSKRCHPSSPFPVIPARDAGI